MMRSIYRFVLRALPAPFRERFGRDMEQAFADRIADTAGPVRRLVVLGGSVFDVIVQAVSERRRRDARQTVENAADRRVGEYRRSIVDSIAQDLRHSFRSILRSPGFAVLAIATLGLGIGATTSVFSVVNALLLRSLPYGEADRLVSVWPDQNFNKTMVHRVAESVPALESVSGISIWTVTVSGDEADPEEVSVALVSGNHFDVLKTRPVLGRAFSSEEGRMGSEGVLILSHAYWSSRFGADPGVVGRTVRMSGAGHDQRTVIGVMAPGFRPVVPGTLAGWVPLEDSTGVTVATDNSFYVNWRVGRLAPGATMEQATAQMRVVAGMLREELPQNVSEEGARTADVRPLHQERVRSISQVLWVLLGAVTLVLLISCANVSNLLLARGEARVRELSVRQALGARAGRVARLLFTEAAVLGLAGGALGVGIAFGLLRIMVANAPDSLPDASSISIDPITLVFAVGASLFATLVAGTAPVLRARGANAADALRQGNRGSAGGQQRQGMSGWLVGVEVALAVLLVVGAGLMLRTVRQLNAVDPGFRADGLLAFRVNPPSYRYGDAVSIRGFYARVNEQLAAVPQIESVAGIQLLPVTTGNWSFGIHAEGHDVPAGTKLPSANFRVVTPGYFETLGVPLLRGRTINVTDRENAPPSAVINQAMATSFFPGEDPIGRELRTFSARGMPFTVVGIVGDVHQTSLSAAPRAEMYVPIEQLPWDVSLWIVARARTGDPMAIAPLVRDAVRAVDPDAPIAGLATMRDIIGDSAATTRFLTLLLGFFGVIALVLGAIGVYGVTSYTVARRMPEFSVRLALGATRRDVLRVAALRGLAPVLLGIAAGSLAALFGARLLDSLLFGVGPRDPIAFAGAPIILALVGLAATLMPALRATRVDPATALRTD